MQNSVVDQNREESFRVVADNLLNQAGDLQSIYWELSEQFNETPYVSSSDQMKDAQKLGQLAEVVNLLRSAQGKLRCINNVNVV